MSAYGHDAIRVSGRDFWDERYRSAPRVWSGDPNPQLVAEIAGRPPGRALDAGCVAPRTLDVIVAVAGQAGSA